MPSIAVFGTNIGSTLHVPALKVTGFEIVALVGRNPERTAQRAAHFGIPRATTSVEEVLDSDVDAVVIASPPDTHYPIAMAALAAGKHILCEKPLALTAAQAREMRDAAAESNLATALQLQLRWMPANLLMRRLISEGKLGDPIQMTANFDNPITQRPGPLEIPEWWYSSEEGGGWLRNLNAHGIDLIRYFLGEFEAVSGLLHSDPARGMTADDGYSVAFVLRNGMQGTMTGTCRSWDMQSEMRMHFANGLASIDVHAPSGLTFSDAEGTRRLEAPADLQGDFPRHIPKADAPSGPLPGTGHSAYEAAHEGVFFQDEQIALCSAFARRIAEPAYHHPALAGFSDGVAALDVIEAIERSAKTRRWVDLRS